MPVNPLLPYLCFLWLPYAAATAQTTGSSLHGRIITNGEVLTGATITLVYEPMGTIYRLRSRTGGFYALENLNPGGPYSMAVSFAGFITAERKDIYLSLGNTLEMDMEMKPGVLILDTVTVSTLRKNTLSSAGGITTVIDRDKINDLPVDRRTFAAYLVSVPQARLRGDGALSFTGQNNRYNSFYIDGAIHNDMYGLSASGTNGGQVGIAPVATDAIDQLQVLLSPYDAALGNFTGAGIHAITKSGSNTHEGSVYYFLQNQDLAGKTPTGPAELATRLNQFSRRNYGCRMGGAITPNRLFYFLNFDILREIQTLPFDISSYAGTTREPAAIRALEATLKSLYRYDPGSFREYEENRVANRTALRIDWNISQQHILTLSTRTMEGLRSVSAGSDATVIHFSNNGYHFPTSTYAISAELKSRMGSHASNKLLITYTGILDDRNPLGEKFPRVRINDGAGAILFGSDNNSTINRLTQKNWTVFDEYRFSARAHQLKIGLDLAYSTIANAFIPNSFGAYTYSSLQAFLNRQAPSAYTYSFPMTDSARGDLTDAAARFGYASAAIFVQDEYRYNHRLGFHLGLRTDLTRFLTSPDADTFTNEIAIPLFAQYRDLRGTQAGLRPMIPLSFSPRAGFVYKIPGHRLVISGGIGLFTGRIPLAWPGGIYQNNGIYSSTYTADPAQLTLIRFRADPNQPWKPRETGGIASKGPLNLLGADFRLPKVMRTSIAIDKKWGDDWSAAFEAYFTENLNEIGYTNINILPPVGNAAGPDRRAVYTTTNQGRIPFNADGTNPYDHAILISNSTAEKGYSYGYSASLRRIAHRGITLECTYSYGQSYSKHDGSSSVNLSQWRFTETVNGRNDLHRSVSDFSAGHRLLMYLGRRWVYARKTMATTFSISYTGESGTAFSYVYGAGSMTRDDGITGANDLIYIPTQEELSKMIFLSNSLSVKGIPVVYTPQEQKEALENYIGNDSYLSKHRGQYAERNGDRLPFTHRINLRIMQQFTIRVNGQRYRLQLSYDLFNVANFLNRNWGHQYITDNDQYKLLSFAGYISATDLTPQYRFDPNQAKTFDSNMGTSPGYSSRWISQAGMRIIF